MELVLLCFFGLLCIPVLIGWDTATLHLPPHLGSYTRALLVSQNRRHLCVTPWLTRLEEQNFVRSRFQTTYQCVSDRNNRGCSFAQCHIRCCAVYRIKVVFCFRQDSYTETRPEWTNKTGLTPGGWVPNKKQGILLLASPMPVESAHDLHCLRVRHTLTKQVNFYYENREIMLNSRWIFMLYFKA